MALNVRVQDLVAAVKLLGGELASADLPSKLKSLETAIAQYENDLSTFRANAEAAHDAALLAQTMVDDGFRKNLRRQQMKVMLLDKLKGSDSKPVLDEAEMNALLEEYERAYQRGRRRGSPSLPEVRWGELLGLATTYLSNLRPADEFRYALKRDRTRMEVKLPAAIAELNATQGELLNRVNYIYDHSEVPEPLPKQINLSGHSGNLIVYYTIRRIETFQRYTVTQVQGPGGGAQMSVQGTAVPPPKGAAPSGTPAGQPNATESTTAGATGSSTANPSNATNIAKQMGGSGQNDADTNQGTVVAKGSFEVHDVFHANVVAAVAFSTLKDQSITKQAQPQSCTGTSANPDANCFSPVVSNSFKWAPIVGLDYYFQPRDTFPRAAGVPWLCSKHPWQCFGIMGAVSVIKANNYFFGGFFEPVLGVQFGAGANFGTRTALQSPYMRGVPVDITGDFPTHDERGTGAFFSAGLDLGIFRKVFGKITGIGTSATGTSGK